MRLLRFASLLVACVFATNAATLTNTPAADTYLEAYGSEAKNFGTSPELRMDQWGGRQVLLRFSVTNVPREHITRATLRLFIVSLGFNEAGEFPELKTCVSIQDVVTPWTELGATHRTPDGSTSWRQGAGIPGGKYIDVGPLPSADIGVHLRDRGVALDASRIAKGKWMELDLTRFVRERIGAEEKDINLLLRSATLGRNYTFASRETNNATLRPQLLIETASGTTPLAVKSAVITQWKPGMPVKLNPAQALPRSVRWSVHKAGTTDTNAAPEGVFRPDGPGVYRSHLSDGSVHGEVADIHVLSVPSHPRIYVSSGSLPKLREDARRGGRIFNAFSNWVANGVLGVASGKYHDMGAKEGCEDTAILYLLTGDPQHARHSIAYAERMLAKPLRAHFKDVHDATFTGASWAHAMALHYDYCFDRLSSNHRQRVAEWLKEAARWSDRRSGAPIAHNDGGARAVLLASAPAALLGDDPEAPQLWRVAYENFEHNLLPWLNDGGRGGRSGDGGEYEGLHAFYIVKFAWMTHTATGVDAFSASPFFFNRLKHVLFGWYPRKLVERSGAYSMRQYYSPSGDHIRMGYVGDTQPYQSAAVLAARYAQSPEAQAVRWLGGDWPTSWMQYTLKWAVLGRWESIPASEPRELTYFDPGCNTVYMRSDWSDDATWVLFENSPLVSAHGSLDSGTFEIFKGDLLAARTGNLDHANVGAKHTMNYLHRTIAVNGLLIRDDAEKWKGFLGGAEGIQDGGGERTNWPLTTSPDADTFLTYRDIFQRGQITHYLDSNGVTYASADLTGAYNSPRFHGGTLNRPKVTEVRRDIVYARNVDSLIVFDRVSSTQPEFKKTWLLHSLGDLDVLDGTERKIDDGEFHYTGATRAVIRHGWPKPVPSFGRCLSVTLLPENPTIVKIGGRVDLPHPQTASWPGDQWHGKHAHQHQKDFWVNGTNYPPGNPPETRWFGDPASSTFVPGTPDETGGRGKWRLEVSPSRPARDDVFLHVLCPRLGREGDFPKITKVTGAGVDGAWIADGTNFQAVLFVRAEARDTLKIDLPSTGATVIVAGLSPGTYMVGASPFQVGPSGAMVIAPGGNKLSIQRRD